MTLAGDTRSLESSQDGAPWPSSRLTGARKLAAPGLLSSEHMSFELQPHLIGHVLELRPLQAEDFASLFAVASDPLIWEQHPDHDRYQEPVFREFFREALESGGALVAVDRATGHIIGSSRYHGYDATAGEVEIGWTFLARAFWGGRFNGEMKRLMLDHAFRWVKRVVFIIGPENRRSQRAVEKIGAVRIGMKADARGRERVVYALTPDQFAGPRRRILAFNGATDGLAEGPCPEYQRRERG